MEIGDTFEEVVNINETTAESVEETEPTENAEIGEYNFYFHFSCG